VKLGVVTSKDPLRTSAILAMLPIEFVCVETPNAVLRGKPAPDHLLMAIARTNVDPAETVYIGDMDVDHQAAMRAGVDYMHAAWGYGNIPDNRTPVVADMREFMELILPAGKRKKGSQ
jgi:phosphoglycolate phosphatase-like HAD superfamily hydrolase